MSTTTRLRSLALGAVAVTMLVAVPAASGNGDGHPAADGHPPGAGHPAAFPVAKFCHRLANNPRLNADQRATVVAACRQLKSDLQAAQAKLSATVNTAQAEVGQARQAAIAACSNGQFDSQACRDARAQAEQVKQQAMQDLNAARLQFQQDVKAAFSTFRSTLAPLKASLGHDGANHVGSS
jgi:hypothetical protein